LFLRHVHGHAVADQLEGNDLFGVDLSLPIQERVEIAKRQVASASDPRVRYARSLGRRQKVGSSLKGRQKGVAATTTTATTARAVQQCASVWGLMHD
jgi:hypothetical protein